jgi:glycerophosphoryl diester phosphodiesterase
VRRLGLVTLVLALALPAPAALAAAEIHAHRGGTLAEGVPVTPENSMTAFRNAVAIGADVVELDAKLTRDGVPVIMHDATLDRATTCNGPVNARTAAELRSCFIDILGTSGNSVPAPTSDERVPTLARVLEWAKKKAVRLNLEIKNQPTDPDFDVTPRFALAVLDAIERSGIPKGQVLIQSFWPLNLDFAQLRGFQTSLLTLGPLNEGGVLYGTARLYDWVSPQWPPLEPRTYVTLAHSLGKKVVPYTLNTDATIRAAGAAGVDAVITDDPPLAQQVLVP